MHPNQPTPSRNSANGIDGGSFRLDGDGLLSFRSGRAVRLPRRLVMPLTVLARSPGRTISKERLLETCWNDTSVTEQSLARAIADLRECFRAEGMNPIQTIYGVGYRFIPPAAQSGNDDAARKAASFRREAAFRIHERRADTLRVAERLLATAIQTHPIPEDWVAAAGVQFHAAQAGYVSSSEAFSKARPLLRRALDERPADALSLLALGLVWTEWDFDKADALLADARLQDPDGYVSNECSGMKDLSAGAFKSAAGYFENALKARPAALPPRGFMVLTQLLTNQREQALNLSRELVQLDPTSPISSALLALAETRLGDPEIGAEAARRSARELPDSPLMAAIHSYALAATGRREQASSLLQSADGRPATSSHSFSCWSWLALDNPERALRTLQKACEIKCPWLPVVLHDPNLHALQSEPEFQALRKLVFHKCRPSNAHVE